ncbi:MAG: lipoprotein-releasing system ATP-binding protein LolD [Gammaproteobacteria bacterium]|nr:lipoprotein-releasing system ATP-binding protein LolD [Gammaproteobacteria bacterium]
MNEVILECSNVSKEFIQGEKVIKVLNEVQFKLNKGSSLAVLGPSGSGKTTLLHILAGLDVPTTGEINFNNHNLNNLDLNKIAYIRNQYMGFVYQSHHLLPEFDAIENVSLPIIISGASKEDAIDKSTDLLVRVGLEKRLFHRPGELSGGERQRVAVARSLANSPSCLIMDEPTGDLDNKNANSIVKLILDLVEEEKLSLVIATHDIKLADNLSNSLNLETN